jgi:CBS domain-containing protein
MERLQNIPKELISDTLNIDYKTPMSKVSPYLKKYQAIVVTKDKEYYGMVDTRTVYRAIQGQNTSTSEKVEKFSVKVPRITNSTSIYDIVNYFYRLNVKTLPYLSGNRVVGVLDRKVFLKVLLSLNTLEDMRVNEAMTTPVLAIDARASVAQAKATMRERNVNRLIVLQNSRFAGLITNYDIVNKYTKTQERLPEMKSQTHNLSNINVGSAMEPNARTIEYNRSLSDAVREMVENKISSLVVTKSKDAIGILTITDVFESILARQKVAASKVFMSGFDANTYQYEDEAREELQMLINHIEKLSGIDVDYVTFKIKRAKSKLYEMQARLSLGRHGIITMHTNKYLFEDAMGDLVKKLKHRVIREKEEIFTHKKINALRDAAE